MSEFIHNLPAWVVLLVVVWEAAWKLPALWKAARNGQLVWFIFIAIINSLGILSILYLLLERKQRHSAK